MTNALILLAATRLLSNDSLLQTTFFDGFVPFKMLALANGVLLLSSLWPFYRGQQNDIQLFWHVSHMGKDELNQLPAAYYFLQAEELQTCPAPCGGQKLGSRTVFDNSQPTPPLSLSLP